MHFVCVCVCVREREREVALNINKVMFPNVAKLDEGKKTEANKRNPTNFDP